MSQIYILYIKSPGEWASKQEEGFILYQNDVIPHLSSTKCQNHHVFVHAVIPKLAEGAVTPVAMHVIVVCLLVLCLLFSALSILISLYNSVSNPYETYMGPAGVYACSSLSGKPHTGSRKKPAFLELPEVKTFWRHSSCVLSRGLLFLSAACLSILALIIFVSNVKLTKMAQGVVDSFLDTNPVVLSGMSSQMLVGYYLVIPYAVLSLVSIVLIYMYDHAAYTHRREQQRPTEDAPKEIMMY